MADIQHTLATLNVICVIVYRAELLVEPNGNYLLVKDLRRQVKLEAKSRDAQHVKIFLGMCEMVHVT